MADFSKYDDFEIEIVRGDSAVIPFITQKDGVAESASIYTEIWLTLKRKTSDPDSAAVLQLTLSGGTIVISTSPPAPLGQCLGNIMPADTASLLPMSRPLELYGDIQGKRGAAEIRTLARFKGIIIPDTTHDET